MRDLGEIYNKINLQTKSSVDKKHLKHKIVIVLIIQGVVGLENLPYAPLPSFLAIPKVPYLKDKRSLP